MPKRPSKQSSCDGKARHEYQAQAAAAKRAMVASGSPHWQINVYKCRFCHGWHLGHPPGFRGRHSRKH